MSATAPAKRVVFVLGLTQRTGTNMVWDLLNLHPDVGTAAPIYEDYLIASMAELDRYVDVAASGWAPRWNIDDGERDRLARHLASGFVGFVAELNEASVVVAKTPSVLGADRFLEIAPENAVVVIVTRAPYPTVRSAVRTFAWHTAKAVKRWESGGEVAARILEQRGVRSDRHVVIRYEDLVDKRAEAVLQILDLAGLDPNEYPMDEAHQLLVRGSSAMVDREGSVSWSDDAAIKTPMQPVVEGRSDIALRCEVERTLGPLAQRLGYQADDFPNMSPLAVSATNAMSDLRNAPRLLGRVRDLGLRQSETVRRTRAKISGWRS